MKLKILLNVLMKTVITAALPLAFLSSCFEFGPIVPELEVETYTLTVRQIYGSSVGRVYVNFDGQNRELGNNYSQNTRLFSGTSVNVRAETVNNNYRFTGWSGASASTDSVITITMDSDRELTANFEMIQYTLTVDQNPIEGGTVSISADGWNWRPIEKDTILNSGTSVRVRAEVDNRDSPNYRFTGWSGASTSTSLEITFTMDSDITLTANFEKIQYTLTVDWTPAEGGTVFVDGEAYTDTITYDSGTSVTIRAEVAPSYSFSDGSVQGGRWGGTSNFYSSDITIVMNGDFTLNFKFRQTGEIPGEPLLDSRDNKTYQTVKIGNLIWMAENLNFTTDNSRCYEDDDANCEIYGRLYTWVDAMNLSDACNNNSCAFQAQSNPRGICPAGWRVPTIDNWGGLTSFVGSSNVNHLKSKSGWNNGGDGTDQYGFSALPGGACGGCGGVGNVGWWWSATERESHTARHMAIEWNRTSVTWLDINKTLLLSVRCVQDVPQ